MKRNINTFIVLALFGFFQASTMEEKENTKKYRTNKDNKKCATLIELACRPLADTAIQIYHQQGFDEMTKYLSNLSLSNEIEVPTDLIERIYHTMVKNCERGDIFIHRLFSLYENSEEIDPSKKIIEPLMLLNDTPAEIKNLLIYDFSKAISRDNGNIDRKRFEEFAKILIANLDIVFLENLNHSFERWHENGQNDDESDFESEINYACQERIYQILENYSCKEFLKVKSSKKLEIPDHLAKVAEKLIKDLFDLYLKQGILVENDVNDLSNFELNFDIDQPYENSKSLQSYENAKSLLVDEKNDLFDRQAFDDEKRNLIVDYIITNHLDKFVVTEFDQFFSLFIDFIYRDKQDKEKQKLWILKKLIKYYPQSGSIIYLEPSYRADLICISKSICCLYEEVCRRSIDKLLNLIESKLLSENDPVIDKVANIILKKYKHFGIRYITIMFINLFKILFSKDLDLTKKLTILTNLDLLAKKLGTQRYTVYLGISIFLTLKDMLSFWVQNDTHSKVTLFQMLSENFRPLNIFFSIGYISSKEWPNCSILTS